MQLLSMLGHKGRILALGTKNFVKKRSYNQEVITQVKA